MHELSPHYDDTWLVIPLYNEAPVIGQVLDEALRTFPHIVCIDDGSSDGSAAIARAHGAVVIQHPFNLGQGAALQTGIEYVRRNTHGRYLVTFDADGQHSVEDATAMVDRARNEDLAIIFGSRFLDDKTKVGWSKKLVLKTAAKVTKHKTGLDLTDAHNGLRLLRRDAMRVVNIRQDGMAHASEIVNQLAESRLPWAEMPVHIEYTDYSKSKGQSLLNSVNILVDLVMR
ncbi:glycosyltransferase family 2 protein [Actinomyces minihominis]|uniref:glycosyltransferase family 2 protein n=1 Tax=Actinomyces minihominis TaxID=2002838 RepID=UPI000C07E6EB|nr:glycosyltransferase family 2 protein [Actinomyces minihominis]